MLYYILNASCIWLISLALYDALLARERFHGLNRAYLLATLLLGIVVPLLHLPLMAGGPGSAAQATYMLKEAIVSSAGTGGTLNWQGLAMGCYTAGACIAALLLVADALRLLWLHRGAVKYSYGSWTIAETGKPQAPFSFGRVLYVQDRKLYTRREWDMLCAHEAVHASRWHVVDVLLLQLCRVVLWFHPLVHVYYHRLRMVHEYQADAQARHHAGEYGRFLLAQAMLQATPSIAHSFNRSPIKKRIIMLASTTSSRWSKLKLVLALPVAIAAISCFSANAGAQQQSSEDTTVHKVAQVMPKATYDLGNYLAENIKYPATARKSKKEGRVIIKFVVDKRGQVKNAKVQKSVDPELDAEALRVVSTMPAWQPGTENGKPVNVYFLLPISFKLD